MGKGLVNQTLVRKESDMDLEIFMEQRSDKNNSFIKFIQSNLSSDNGSVLLTTVVLMILMTFIGISGVNIASTDLQISRSYRLYQENLALAEAAVNIAMSKAERALDENIAGRDWLEAELGDGFFLIEDLQDQDVKYLRDEANYNPLVHLVTNAIDVRAVIADWGNNDAIEPRKVELRGIERDYLEYVAYVQISTGDLDTRKTSVVVIARSRKNGGDVILERGLAYVN